MYKKATVTTMDNRQNSEQAPQGKNKKTLLMWLGILLGVLVLIYMLSVPGKVLGGEEQEVSYDTFLKHLEEGKIEKVDLKSETILYKLKTEALPTQAPTATFAPGQEGTFFGFRTLGGSYSPIDYVKKEPASPTYSTIRLDDEGLVERLLAAGVSFGGVKEEGSVFLYLLLQFAPMLLLVLFYM